MINKAIIKHFQSHNKSILKFSPGINSIIGSSDKGKSAIFRALVWVINNKPVGNSFVSHWNLDKSGKENKIIEPTYVKLKTDNHVIKRERSNDFNGYILDSDQSFKALRSDVPEEIKEALNISEVNIQHQMDSPFLLSSSSGEVARFFNKTIRLDIIDKMLSWVESKKRKIRDDLKGKNNLLINNESELQNYDWVKKAEPLINKAEEVEKRIEEKFNIIQDLISFISDYKILKTTIEGLKNIDCSKDMEEWYKTKQQLDKLEIRVDYLITSIEEYQEYQEIIKNSEKLINSNKLLDKYWKIYNKIKEKNCILEKLDEEIEDYVEYSGDILDYSNEIIELKKELPNTCPICNSKLGEKK